MYTITSLSEKNTKNIDFQGKISKTCICTFERVERTAIAVTVNSEWET